MWTNFPLFPDSASSLAPEVDALYFFGVGVAVFFSLLIAVLILYLGLKYRRRAPGEIGQREKAATWLEVLWSVVPLAILIFMFWWGARVFFVARRPPADAIEYYVVAKQWMWKFQHPEGTREINSLHVPAGQPVKLTMTSEDVIHSFFAPEFRVKMDVIPGRYSTVWFEATKTGTFKLFCTEYCGAEHSQMGGTITVMDPADYERWLSGSGSGQAMATSGEALFASLACNTCHRPDTAARAPILAGLLGKQVELQNGRTIIANETYVRESILRPAAKVVAGYDPVMPTYQGQVSEEQLLELLTYLKSLAEAG